MRARPTAVVGCFELELQPALDARGGFLKIFQSSVLAGVGLPFEVRELFVTRSRRDVVRGLHFQGPPSDVAKLVACVEGSVLDAVVDLRVGSPTYREHCAVELSPERANAMFVPHGCAHGFLATSDDAVMLYAQSGEYDAEHEGGVLWSSVGIDWPVTEPVLSERDAAFVTLAAFDSPFTYTPVLGTPVIDQEA
jgi:dTDP-4-dehydrorhamnose 3,5-epimerase